MDEYDQEDLSVAKSALNKVRNEWLFHFICWLLIYIGVAAVVIYGVQTGKIQRFDNDTSSPVIEGMWAGYIFVGLLFLPCIPTYFRLLFRRYSLRPTFEVTETTIIWSDGTKTKTNDATVTNLLNLLVFLMRALIDLFIAFLISPLNMFIILPFKARSIRKEYDIKGPKLFLGNFIFILLIIGCFVAMIAFMIIKWAPEIAQDITTS